MSVRVLGRPQIIKDYFSKLSKKEILSLLDRRCVHGHNILSQGHTSCFFEDNKQERIGFLDIEAEDLNADYGVIFNYCILDNNSNKIYSDRITKEDIKKWGKSGKDDTRLIGNLVRDIGRFTKIVGHYSSRYDLPFIRTRAVICGVDFPSYGTYTQGDTWNILRSKFKISRNSLEAGTRVLLGESRKNHLSLPVRNGCVRGEKWALDYSDDHCQKDVMDTKDLFNRIYMFSSLGGSPL